MGQIIAGAAWVLVAVLWGVTARNLRDAAISGLSAILGVVLIWSS